MILRIRAAQADEAGLLSQLAMDSKTSWGYAPDVMEAWRSDLTITPDAIAAHLVYVAEEHGMVVGFYMLQAAGPTWVLEHLWVRPDRMRRGVGSQMLQSVLSTANHSGLSRVHVAADPNAAGFYERQGGVRAGSRPAPIPGMPDRVISHFTFESHGRAGRSILLRVTAWGLRILILVAVGLLCGVSGSLRPAVAFAVTLVPGIIFVTAFLTGHLRYPPFLNTVYPIEPVIYRWLGVGIVKRLVATRIWPVLVGVVPPPRPKIRREFLNYIEGSTQGAEISHWATFVLAIVLAVVCLAGGRNMLAVWIIAFNILLNGYPIMLQRANRWRVQQLRAALARVARASS
ncbi:MAG: GNAT family N-acetyltransferase [Pseudomonadota bacterium]